jgi:predicted nucleic acid-binding protein
LKLTPVFLRASIFVDTSAFFALADRTDRLHNQAIQFFELNERLLVSSSLVAYETITLVRMRLGYEPAVKVGEMLLDQGAVPLIRATIADERKAWQMFKRYSDKRFSFVDCASFVLMRRLGIQAAFAFDRDFRQMGGWVVYPQSE